MSSRRRYEPEILSGWSPRRQSWPPTQNDGTVKRLARQIVRRGDQRADRGPQVQPREIPSRHGGSIVGSTLIGGAVALGTGRKGAELGAVEAAGVGGIDFGRRT